jgi:GT2 family glycosyltransferase
LAEHISASVIVPVYSDQEGLNMCLRGLSAQTFPRERMEVIVVDNGSKPEIEVPAWAITFARRVMCETPGSYAARNRGVDESIGDVLTFTDADCIPEPHWLEKGVEAVERHGHGHPVGGEVVLFSSRSSPSAVETYQIAVGFRQKENITQQLFSVTANLFVPRRVFERVGTFDESLLSGGDRDWGWRANRHGCPVEYEPQAVVRHPCRSSLSGIIRQMRRNAGGQHRLRTRKTIARALHPTERYQRPIEGLRRLLRHPDLRGVMLIKILGVASILRLCSEFERVRLHGGGAPLR